MHASRPIPGLHTAGGSFLKNTDLFGNFEGCTPAVQAQAQLHSWVTYTKEGLTVTET